ncbi:MAG: LysR family transcriptional regulator [Pseudomonadota bacterium]
MHTDVDEWDKIRTAYTVAKIGTVSGAAEALGYHRATVIRHVDTLEASIGAKLFLRHERGYSTTEVGRDLLDVATAADGLFGEFFHRTKAQTNSMDGPLTISGSSIVMPLLLPAIAKFRESNPGVQCRYEIQPCKPPEEMASPNLQYGDVHIAVIGGPKPTYDDYIVRRLFAIRTGMYATQSYFDKYGKPTSVDEFSDHWFVGVEDPNGSKPFAGWSQANIPANRWALISDNIGCVHEYLMSGLGIGFCPEHEARSKGLIEVVAPKAEWDWPFWLVTHRDMRRSAKVTAFIAEVNECFSTLPTSRRLGGAEPSRDLAVANGA